MRKKLFSLAKTPIGDLIIGLSFGKLSRFLPVKKLVETDKVVAFWHPKPLYQKHILIVPKKSIKTLTSLKNEDMECIVNVFSVAKELVKKFDMEKEGYTLLTNGGKTQEVNQLHFHLISQAKPG